MTTYPPRLAVFLLVLFLSACGSKQQGPSGIDAFLKDYQAAYEARDREAIMLHIDWQGIDEELREYSKVCLFPFAGWREIRSIEHKPYEVTLDDRREFEGRAIVPAGEPTHRIEIIFEPVDRNAQPERYEFLAAEHDGELKLCGWAFEE